MCEGRDISASFGAICCLLSSPSYMLAACGLHLAASEAACVRRTDHEERDSEVEGGGSAL